jgi:hypothetical protein
VLHFPHGKGGSSSSISCCEKLAVDKNGGSESSGTSPAIWAYEEDSTCGNAVDRNKGSWQFVFRNPLHREL